jgi:YHS domain-containing protein
MPLASDPAGSASRFVGKDDRLQKASEIEGTVSAVVKGKPYAGDFQIRELAAGPAKKADDQDTALYLKPGGAYTQSDIDANGRVTPRVKYKGFVATHDIKPKVGDRLCPVTLTKSNAKLTWVVAGKTYEFCCPPCLDEFVQMAKEKPGELKTPQDYVKK